MIPVSLTLQGIYSYRRRVVIDFKPLTDARLFGIFGRTGSGKSTLIEAITFAVYGETERLNKRDGRAYNMMNLRSNELLIDFEFTAGHPVQGYRCIVKGQRNRRRFDDAKSYEHTAYRRDGNNWLPVTLGEVQEAVGLNYENFRRAVIIPQGRFQDFLQLTDTDRTRMMKELFDLERFELAPGVTHLENENNGNIRHLEGKLSGIEVKDDVWFNEQNERVTGYDRQLGSVAEAIAEINNRLARLVELASLYNEREEKKTELGALTARTDEMNLLEQHTRKVGRCRSNFQAAVETLASSEKQLAELTPRLHQQSAEAEKLKNSEKLYTAEYDVAEADYSKNEGRIARAGVLMLLAEQAALFEKINDASRRLSRGNEMLEAELSVVAPLRSDVEQRQQRLLEEKSRNASVPVLAELIAWFDRQKLLQQQAEGASAALESERQQHDGIKLQRETILTSLAKEFETPVEGFDIRSVDEAAVQHLAEKEATLLADEQHLALQLNLQRLSGTLSEGEACPVCGSTHHPSPLSQTDFRQAEDDLKNRRKLFNSLKSRLELLRRDLAVVDGQMSASSRRLGELNDQCNTALAGPEQHKNLFPGGSSYLPTGEAAVRLAWTETQQRLSVQQTLEKEFSLLQKDLTERETTIARYRERIGLLENQLAELKKQMDELQKQAQFTNEELSRDPATVKAEAEGMRKDAEQATARRDKALEQLRSVQQKVIQAETVKHMIGMQVSELTASSESRREQIHRQALAEGFDGIGEVKLLLMTPFDEAAALETVSRYRSQVVLLQQRLAVLEALLAAEPYNEELHRETTVRSEALSAQRQEMVLALDRLKREIKKAADDRGEALLVNKQLDEARVRAADLATLARLFKASGFVSYVSSVFLEQLIGIANRRFHVLTGRQLSMELAGGNNIVIRDYLNGGHIRSVKTLSGGQTFQASLSLALALADVVHARRPGTDNFFFLDEGFGSLDRDSLQMVFDTLRTLRLENRIVGLISHVEELQQEIDACIRVVNDDEEGSRIV